jgi:Na+-transporting methylmalonyl-CoA/oxaloacetate decarboxylase gamma subunit
MDWGFGLTMTVMGMAVTFATLLLLHYYLKSSKVNL